MIEIWTINCVKTKSNNPQRKAFQDALTIAVLKVTRKNNHAMWDDLKRIISIVEKEVPNSSQG